MDTKEPFFIIKVNAKEFGKALENASKDMNQFKKKVKENRGGLVCPKCGREIYVWDKRENYKGKIYHYNCLLMKVDKKGRSKDLLMKRLY